MRHLADPTRGTILIVVLIFILIIAGASGALLGSVGAHNRSVEYERMNETAFAIAEGAVSEVRVGLLLNHDGVDNDGDGRTDEGSDGVDNDNDGLVDECDEMEYDPRLGTASWTSSDDGGGTVTGRFANPGARGTGNGRPDLGENNVQPIEWTGGRYIVWLVPFGADGVDNDGDGTTDEADEAGEGEIYVQAEVQGAISGITTLVSLIPAMRGNPNDTTISPVFGNAAFGDDSVTMDSNSITDSYKSTLGNYAGQATNRFRGQPYARQDGDIGSNGAVALKSNAQAHGDAAVASGGSLSNIGNSVITGSQVTNAATQTLPTVVMPPVASQPGTGFSLSSNGSHTFASGDYHFSSFVANSNTTVTITGPATLVIDAFRADSNTVITIDATNGPVTIVGTGSFDLNSNATIQPNTQKAKDLNVILTGNNLTGTDAINIDSNSGLIGRIFAPNAKVTVNSNAGVTGQIVAKQVHVDSNGAIHYDEDLANVPFPNVSSDPGSPSHIPIKNWRWERSR